MKILDDLGMNPANLGYTFWEEAIKLRNGNYFDIQMTHIYNELAIKFNLNPASIERCMRNSRNKIKNINKKIDVDYKIDNKTFLALLVKNNGGKND